MLCLGTYAKFFTLLVLFLMIQLSTLFIDMQYHNPKRGTGFVVNPRRWCLCQLIFTVHATFFQLVSNNY